MGSVNNIVHGKRCVFFVNLGTGYYPVVCAKGFTFSPSTELKDITSRGSGIFKEYAGKSQSYSIQLSGLIKVKDLDGDVTFFDLVTRQKQMIAIPFRAHFVDNDGDLLRFKGIGLINSMGFSANAGQLADSTVDITGTGEWHLENDTDLGCSNTVTGISINGTSYPTGSIAVIPNNSDVTIQITALAASSPEIFRYDYDIDGAGRNSVFTDGSLPWTFLQIEFSGYDPGPHTILIIPVCENGFDGQTTTINLSKSPPL